MVGWTLQKIHPMDIVVLTKDWSVHLPLFFLLESCIAALVHPFFLVVFPQNPSNVFHMFLKTQPPKTQASVNRL